MTKKILIVILLFCYGLLFGQTKDTLYLKGDTVKLKQDANDKSLIHTIIFSAPIGKAVSTDTTTVNWEKVSSITQIIGTFLVFLTIVSLIIQIRIANKQTIISNKQAAIANKNNQLSTFQHVRDTINGFSDLIAQSSELTEILIRGRKSYLDLPPVDKIRFERIHARLFNLLEAWYTLIDEMHLSEKFKNAQLKNINEAVKSFFRYKGVMEFWESYKKLYIPELDDIIRSCTAEVKDDTSS